MTAREYIEQMAREGRVEQIVRGTAGHDDLTTDELDCVQMIYETLLRYDEGKIAELGDKGQLGFFAAGIARNMLLSKTSRYYYEIRKFNENSIPFFENLVAGR